MPLSEIEKKVIFVLGDYWENNKKDPIGKIAKTINMVDGEFCDYVDKLIHKGYLNENAFNSPGQFSPPYEHVKIRDIIRMDLLTTKGMQIFIELQSKGYSI